MSAANMVTLPLSGYKARHVGFAVDGKVATLTLDRPDKKNPLTFESYAEIVDLFRAAAKDKGVKAIVVTGAGGNFCSGGDVFEIIEPLTKIGPLRSILLQEAIEDYVKPVTVLSKYGRRQSAGSQTIPASIEDLIKALPKCTVMIR